MREALVKSEEFKDSPVGGIPIDWEVRKLTDIASYQNGKSFPSSDYSESGTPLLRPGNLPDDDFVLWDEAHTTYLPLKWAELAPDYIVLAEELVMNLTAQSLEDQFLGRVCMTPPDTFCLLNQRIARFRAKDCYLPFLFWALKGTYFRAQIDRIPQGTKVQHIYNSDLNAIILPMPKEQSEQRAIAEILFTLSALVRSQESLIAKLKQMKAGLLHDLLTRGLDENGELRDAIAHPEQFKDSSLGQIPKDWEVLKLESLLNGRPKNGYSPKEVNEWTGTLMLGLGCLTEEGFEPLQLKNAPSNDLKIQAALLNDGDFLLSRSNTRERVALAGIYHHVGLPCIYSDLMMRLSLNEKTCNRFLELLLRHFPVRRQLTGNAQGTSVSMVKISSQTVIETLVALPNPTEQLRIIKCVDTYDTRIRAEEAYRDKLKLQKQGLMHDLLTGKVRVKDADKFTAIE
jgi:type I restriction enzyme S subunit